MVERSHASGQTPGGVSGGRVVKLSDTDIAALRAVKQGNLPCDELPERAGVDMWGDPVPGVRTYRRLERMGLVIFVEEDPVSLPGLDAPFTFTAFLELTPEGEAALGSV